MALVKCPECGKDDVSDSASTCPNCGSTNVSKISTLNRGVSIAVVGLASSKIGKLYECNNCKHKW